MIFLYISRMEKNIVGSFSNKERRSLSTNWRYDKQMNKYWILVHLQFDSSNLDGYGKI